MKKMILGWGICFILSLEPAYAKQTVPSTQTQPAPQTSAVPQIPDVQTTQPAQQVSPVNQFNPGDIRIFNMPIVSTANLKVKLFYCDSSHSLCSEKMLVPLYQPPQELAPADYFTYSPGDMRSKLQGQHIYIKLYDTKSSQWSSGFELIQSYDPTEAPFYQFICNYDTKYIPYCTIGTMEELG